MNHIQHEVKNIWLDLVQNGSMIKRTIILRRITLYHIATAYLPTFCIMIMAIITLYIDASHVQHCFKAIQ